MKIGNLNFEKSVFLAPMAGVTDISFRGLCKEMGCGLVYTEMVSAKALYYGSENTQALLRIADEEKPVAAQIFGNDPKIMAEVVQNHFNKIDDICILDINMGCPAPKITKNGEGSALMLNPKLAGEIVSEIKKVSNKPVTVKFRKGYDDDNINAVEFAKIMEYSGADAIAIHGRTKKQMYEGKADWEYVKKMKEILNIPVIGNGDIKSVDDAINMLNYTKCDGIMIGRGAVGNPFLIKQISDYLDGKDYHMPTYEQRINMAYEHAKRLCDLKGEYIAMKQMRGLASWYIQGMPFSARVKNECAKLNTYEDLTNLFGKYLVYLKAYEQY